MPHHIRHRLQDQEGFTLIELLVVILIIGILAAVAIPTFLTQTKKASDANVEAALGVAHTTEATYRAANNAYANSVTALSAMEPALGAPQSNYSMTAAYYAASGAATSTSGYQITATNPKDAITYTLTYDAATGTVGRTCNSPGTGSCSPSSTWGS